MIRVIARKEMLEMVRDGRFRVASVVILGLLLVALAAGWNHYRSVNVQHEAAQAQTREQWLAQGAKNPHSAAHYGIYAFKPKMPLSVVDRGVDSYVGVAAWLEAHRQNDFLYRPAQDGTVAQRFGELTAAGVLQRLVPLLIILLAFGAFAGERETGTLRQLLSIGVRRGALVRGKAAGLAGALALLLVPAALIGSFALTLAMGVESMTAALPRVAVMSLGYLAYFGVFLALALAVSAIAPSSRIALLALIAFWIVNSLLVPRAATDVAKRLHPAPSTLAFLQAVDRDVQNGLPGELPRAERERLLEEETLAQYGVSRAEELPVNYSGIRLQRAEEYANRVYDLHWGALWDTYARQNRVQEAMAVISPLLAIRSFSMAVAGTDFEQHRDFAATAESYRRDLNLMMNEDLAASGPAGQPYLADADLWARVPPFDYESPSLGRVLGRQSENVAVLLVWLLMGGIFTIGAARRLPTD